MYAQLGTNIFENLKSFTDYYRGSGVTYAEQPLIDDKPDLQFTGANLDELSLRMRLHVTFCNPEKELQSLKDSMNNGEVLPLLYGNGKLAGSFVITDIRERIEDVDGVGNVFSYLVDVELKEYVAKDKLQSQQAENRKNATAVGNKKPVAQKKNNPSTCATTISGIITKVKNHSDAINGTVLLGGGSLTTEGKFETSSHLTAIKLLCQDLIKRTGDSSSCAYGSDGLSGSAESTLSASDSFTASLPVMQPDIILQKNSDLVSAVADLKRNGQSFLTSSILRK
ncbi:phage tail protein [Arachidicoccus terrestris]|uniref:phage tail protein n=1 Tax=Arachidicoccus terrestris TaxID=2875539 RepID=UPI001CC510AA|nr:phage tail protein [Arachidicoccus terrestris]UAY56267.1 phage tail protein [Arachidicoccus terrestris]